MVSEDDKSEFNSSIATLKRIDEIKKGIALATLSNNYELHFRCLRAYCKELTSVMNDDDDKIQRKRYNEMMNTYEEYRNLLRKKHSKIPKRIILAFDNWDFELRNIEQKYGLNVQVKGAIDETPEGW